MRRLVAALLLSLALTPASAVNPDERLADPALEARAREISRDLRCLVCQNQSIDDSDAPLARDLRLLVRERLLAGDSNAEVETYLVERYGPFIKLTPPFDATTWALWLAPPLVLLIGGTIVWRLRRQSAAEPEATPLSDEERSELAALLNKREGGNA